MVSGVRLPASPFYKIIEYPYLFELGKGEQALNEAIFRVRNYMAKKGVGVLFESNTFVSFQKDGGEGVYVYMFKNNDGQPGYVQIAVDSTNELAEKAMVSKLVNIVRGSKKISS